MKRGAKNNPKSNLLNIKSTIIIFILLLLALIIFFNITKNIKFPSESPPSSGLQAYLPLNETLAAGTTFRTPDTSGNNRVGLVTGATLKGGKVSNSFLFDGVNDYIKISGSENIQFSQFTTSAWVYKNNNVENWARIVSKYWYASATSKKGFAIDIGDTTKNSARCYIDTDQNIYTFYFPDNSVPKETWVHLACVYDGSRIRGYINGKYIGEKPAANVLAQNTYPIIIGASSSGTSYQSYFSGKIDEVFVYNSALQHIEILALYNNGLELKGLANDFSPNVGYYHDLGNGVIPLRNLTTTFVSSNGTNFRQITQTEITNQNIPTSNIIIGYYHPHGGSDGRISLWNSDGNVYVWTPSQGKFNLIPRTDTFAFNGLPTTFIPKIGYYHGFVGGIGVLQNETDSYVWNPKTNVWTKSNPADFGLPNVIPKLAYYYRISNCPHYTLIGDIDGDGDVDPNDGTLLLSYKDSLLSPSSPTGDHTNAIKCGDINGDGTTNSIDIDKIGNVINGQDYGGSLNAEVHRWYLENGQTKLYAWNGSNKFKDITSSIVGLPDSPKVPNVGYYDKFNNRLVLWYGPDAYASSDGRNFVIIKDGQEPTTPPPEPECTTANQATDCNDNDSSTTDTCQNGNCVNTPISVTCTTANQATVCGSGEVCLDSVCVAGDLCIDRDSENNIIGINPNERAEVVYANGTVAGTDRCRGTSSSGDLTEWFCNEDGEPESIKIGCLGDCLNGACVDEFDEIDCSETDDDRDYDNQGTVTLSFDEEVIKEFTDECINRRKLKEYYCDNSEIKFIERSCGSSKDCIDGECVQEDDGGSGDGAGDGGDEGGGTSSTTTCTNGERSCLGTNSRICINGAWTDLGKISGQCEYSSSEDEQDLISCESDAECDSGSCGIDGYCQLEEEEKNLRGLYTAIIIIIILILITVGVIVYIAIKKQNHKSNMPKIISSIEKPFNFGIGSSSQQRRP